MTVFVGFYTLQTFRTDYIDIDIEKLLQSHLFGLSASQASPLADLGGGAPGACPPHLPGILVFIGGSRGCARRAPPHLPGILVFDHILGYIV